MESIIGANAFRVSRLTSDGTPDFGNDVGAFLVCGGITTVEHNFETETGSSIFQKDAAGNVCINRRRRDDVKFTTFTITLCRDDWRLTEILLEDGARLLTDDNDYPKGRGILGTRGCGTAETGNGVLIELWSELVDCAGQADPYPYLRTVFPRCFLVPQGHRKEDGASLPVYQGFAEVNPNIGNGPFDDFDVQEDLSDLIYLDFGDTELPTCATPVDYVELPVGP
jgi:hypothetical protein